MFKSAADSVREPVKDNTHIISTFTCDYCDEGGWNSETELVIHKKSCHTIEINNVAKQTSRDTCLTCSSIFPKNELICHYKQAHLLSSPYAERIEREIFVCDYCNSIFFNKSVLELHISKKHFRLFFLECPICKRKLRSNTIWRHLESHTVNSISTCPICFLKSTNTSTLHKHLASHPKHYNCNLCGYATTKEANFASHLKRYAEVQAKLEEYAGLQVMKYYLRPNKHCQWHKSLWNFGIKGLMLVNKLYICVLCRHICTNVTECQKHIYVSHMKPLPLKPVMTTYACVCGEQFSTSILLKQHVFRLKDPHGDVRHDKAEQPNVNKEGEVEIC